MEQVNLSVDENNKINKKDELKEENLNDTN